MRKSLLASLVLLSTVTMAQPITWLQVPYPGCGGTGFAHNSQNGKLYKSAWNGYGAMMSVDSGYTWTPISPAGSGALNIAMKGDTLVVPYTACNPLQGPHYTVDDGQTWVYMNGGGSDSYDMACNQSTLFLANGSTTRYTSDWGATWQILSTPMNSTAGSGSYSVDASGNDICVGSTSGVYVSNDNGQNWTFKSIPNVGIAWSVYINGSMVFAGTTNGLFKSFDGGSTFVLQQNLNNPNIVTIEFFGNTGYLSAINNATSNPPMVYVTYNSGATWNYANAGLDPTHEAWAFYKIGTMMLCGTDYGVYQSQPGSILSAPEVPSSAVSVFPNPATDQVMVSQYDGSEQELTRVEWVSTAGMIVKSEELNSYVANQHVLNCGELKKGMYLLRFYDASDRVVHTQKVMLE